MIPNRLNDAIAPPLIREIVDSRTRILKKPLLRPLSLVYYETKEDLSTVQETLYAEYERVPNSNYWWVRVR